MLKLATMLVALALSGCVECGACGAHVQEWHYVRGWDGSPVAVCAECFEWEEPR